MMNFNLSKALIAATFVALAVCYPSTASAITVPFVPTGLNPGDEYHVAFVTRGTRLADSTDIADYNTFVQDNAELPGAITENWGINWKVIGSTSTVDARDNAFVEAPVYLLSDALVATGFSDIWDGSIATPLSIDQFGADNSLASGPATGSLSNGTGAGAGQLGHVSGVNLGFAALTNNGWISSSFGSSFSNYSYYALSEKLTVAGSGNVVPEPTTAALGLMGVAGLVMRRRRAV